MGRLLAASGLHLDWKCQVAPHLVGWQDFVAASFVDQPLGQTVSATVGGGFMDYWRPTVGPIPNAEA